MRYVVVGCGVYVILIECHKIVDISYCKWYCPVCGSRFISAYADYVECSGPLLSMLSRGTKVHTFVCY
jgi:hypothetical protein